jgi:sucrose-6-phosphate hydrolase SacC (GH32 family)
LCDSNGTGGLFVAWDGDNINIDDVMVPLNEWKPGDQLELRMFIDNQLVEIFINGGKYCVSRQVRREFIKGKHVALTALGGTAKFVSVKGSKLKKITVDYDAY